jgi:hypothetical protein
MLFLFVLSGLDGVGVFDPEPDVADDNREHAFRSATRTIFDVWCRDPISPTSYTLCSAPETMHTGLNCEP